MGDTVMSEEVYMLDEHTGETKTIVQCIRDINNIQSESDFHEEIIIKEDHSNELENGFNCSDDQDSHINETLYSFPSETSGNSDVSATLLDETSNKCSESAVSSCHFALSSENDSGNEEELITPELEVACEKPKSEVKEEQTTEDISKEDISILNDSAHDEVEDLNCSDSFTCDDKIGDYKSVTDNLFKTCSEVEKILKSVGQDDSTENSSHQNSKQSNEAGSKKQVMYKCAHCSFVDQNVQRLFVHLRSCVLKRKASQDGGESIYKRRQAPIAIAPKPGLPSSVITRLPVSSNAQYIIAPSNKVRASKVQVALAPQASIPLPTSQVASSVSPAQTRTTLVPSSPVLNTTNTRYVITTQPTFAPSNQHGVLRPQVPIIPSAPITISQPQIPIVPSSQLAVTPQGQLTFQPGTQFLLANKPSSQNSGIVKQPTLLGVGIGSNPALAAKNIVLLPNMLLNSLASGQQNGTKPNISLQPPIIIQNSAPNNPVSSVPFQQNILFSSPISSGHPQVLLSPICLSSKTVSNINNKTAIVNVVPQSDANVKQSISGNKSSASPNVVTIKKKDQSEITKSLPKKPNSATYICELCDDYLKDLAKLRHHMKCLHEIHIHPKMLPGFNCQKCQYCFFTEQGLERHLVGSHGLVSASLQEAADKGKDGGRCPICGWGYQSKLLDHIATEHKVSLKPADLSYKCTLCTATFEIYKKFEKHIYSVHQPDIAKLSKIRQKSVSSATTVK